MSKELKDFQEVPSFELFDKVYQLGRNAIVEYGEEEFGNFLISLAFHYRTRLFEIQTRQQKILLAKILENIKPEDRTSESVEIKDEDLESIDFNKLKKH